jgi:murein DD-endopeptidase MepM/ murein hydrolase activator NlpD
MPRSRRELRQEAARLNQPTPRDGSTQTPAQPVLPTPERPAEPVSAQRDASAPQSAARAPQSAPRAKASKPRTKAGAEKPQTSVAPGSARPRRSAKHLSRSTGAALAITALVVGTALPAIGLVRAQDGNASTTSASDIRAQSFTAASGVLPDVQVHGAFTATTPTELTAMQAATAAAAKTGVASIAKPGQVIYPMSAGSYTLTDGFGAARTGRSHMGQDFAAPIGTPIYAAADGCVTMSQESYQGYGVSVEIAHPALSGAKAVSTLYAHMTYGSRAVQVGECVTAGQFIGRVGDTGWTVGSCLHFEVHINDNAIDPLAWLESNVF